MAIWPLFVNCFWYIYWNMISTVAQQNVSKVKGQTTSGMRLLNQNNSINEFQCSRKSNIAVNTQVPGRWSTLKSVVELLHVTLRTFTILLPITGKITTTKLWRITLISYKDATSSYLVKYKHIPWAKTTKTPRMMLVDRVQNLNISSLPSVGELFVCLK